MSLFHFGKKREEKKAPSCNCGCSVKVLGAGCPTCHKQYEYVKKAVENMGLSVEVEYITDIQKVMAYGVMKMPAVVVNEKVVSMGKLLKPAEVEKLLSVK